MFVILIAMYVIKCINVLGDELNEIYICSHGVLRKRCEWALVSGFMVHQVLVEKALYS